MTQDLTEKKFLTNSELNIYYNYINNILNV